MTKQFRDTKYCADDTGRIFNSRTGKELRQQSNGRYNKVTLTIDGKQRQFLVHRIVVWQIYNLITINKSLRKINKALGELHTMPIDEWEAKWGEFMQKEYDKCDDPHKQEIEEDMEFFHKELEELKKGG